MTASEIMSSSSSLRRSIESKPLRKRGGIEFTSRMKSQTEMRKPSPSASASRHSSTEIPERRATSSSVSPDQSGSGSATGAGVAPAPPPAGCVPPGVPGVAAVAPSAPARGVGCPDLRHATLPATVASAATKTIAENCLRPIPEPPPRRRREVAQRAGRFNRGVRWSPLDAPAPARSTAARRRP